ncbi:MAG: hypothetical protein K2H75_08710 [Muribaculaceae bacterium]|nr:hypothetical protein [Muribaculaceae bacterium]
MIITNHNILKTIPTFRRLIQGNIALLLLCLVPACSGSKEENPLDSVHTSAAAEIPVTDNGGYSGPELLGLRIRINNIGPLNQVFNDLNPEQMRYATQLGIDPITNLRNTYFTKRPVVRLKNNEAYVLDSLTHSLPYLVPEAERLLHRIGMNFIDSLKSRGAGGYRIKVTSVLRTAASVKELRKVNVNATEESTHQYGTTFDISYSDFPHDPTTPVVEREDLKNLLGEVLADLRRDSCCLVKYEKTSPCFHVTATR